MIVSEEFLHGIGWFDTPSRRLREPTEDEMYYGLIIPYNWAHSWLHKNPVNGSLPMENLPRLFQAAAVLDPNAWNFWSQFQVQRAYFENRLYNASTTDNLHAYPFGTQFYTRRIRSIALAKKIQEILND